MRYIPPILKGDGRGPPSRTRVVSTGFKVYKIPKRRLNSLFVTYQVRRSLNHFFALFLLPFGLVSLWGTNRWAAVGIFWRHLRDSVVLSRSLVPTAVPFQGKIR